MRPTRRADTPRRPRSSRRHDPVGSVQSDPATPPPTTPATTPPTTPPTTGRPDAAATAQPSAPGGRDPGTDWTTGVPVEGAAASSVPRRWSGLPLAVAAAVGTAVLVPTGPAEASSAGSAGSAADPAGAPAARASRSGAATAVVTRTQAAPLPATARSAGVVYTVRSGDTLSHIALRTGTSVAALIAANGLDARGSIHAGQRITLPGAAPRASGGAARAASTTRSHTVRPGDTVSQIALRAGTTTAAIVAANRLDRRATIRVGQVLRLPGGSSPSSSSSSSSSSSQRPASGGRYTVRAGDTLSQIATRHGSTLAALRAANPGLDARSTIRVGQVLRLPAGGARVPSSFAGRDYPSDTVRAAQANSDALAARSVPSRAAMQQLIAQTARARGVDPALAQAIAFQESGFNMRAVSPANAVGAMQVIPSSGRWASDLAGRRLDLLDPRDNALAGVLILRALLRAEPDRATAIAGYYQGLGSVRRNGMYPDTRRYVANIQTLTARFR